MRHLVELLQTTLRRRYSAHSYAVPLGENEIRNGDVLLNAAYRVVGFEPFETLQESMPHLIRFQVDIHTRSLIYEDALDELDALRTLLKLEEFRLLSGSIEVAFQANTGQVAAGGTPSHFVISALATRAG